MRQVLTNPYGNSIKNYISGMLKDSYSKHELVVEKITEIIKTEKDYKAFGDFIMAVYGEGYTTAVDQQRETLEKMGLKARIVKTK